MNTLSLEHDIIVTAINSSVCILRNCRRDAAQLIATPVVGKLRNAPKN